MKTKRLLSFAVATTMLLSLLNIGAFANEVKTGALSIKSPDPITVGTETVDVDFTLTFDEETKSPHSLCTIVTDLELKALAVKTVDGEVPPTYNGSEGEPDDGLVTVDTVTISNDGADLANKKVVFESGVDSNAPVVTEIVFTATFNTADKAEGTYTVGATVDATNYDENDFNITVGEDAVVTIEEAVVEPECEHEWEVVSAVPATADSSHNETTKGSIVFTCTKCGNSKTEEVSYYRYYACASTNAAYESEIQFQLNARKVHLERQGAYEEAFIKIVKSYATEDEPIVKYLRTTDAEEKTIGDYDCYTWSIGIPAKELNDNINANVYVKFNGTWYSGQPTDKSVVDYAMNVISSASETEKTLIANMLNYGAKAQIFFGYNEENLADANLGDYSSYVTTDTALTTDYYDNPYNTSNSEVILHKFNLEMASKVGLRAYFRTDFYTTGELNDLKVTASYETSAGTTATTYTSEDYVLESGYTDRYTFNYDVIPAKFMRAKIKLVAYNGEDSVSVVVTHSIESLVARLWNSISTAEQAVYSAMLNFGDAAAAHFVV